MTIIIAIIFSLFYLRNIKFSISSLLTCRWEVFLLVKCQISCKYIHSQSMMIRTMLTALSLFHSHWTAMGWCSFVWIKAPVGLVLCSTGGTKPSSQQRMTLEQQTQLGKYLSVSLCYFITYNYPGGRAMWWSTVNFSSIRTMQFFTETARVYKCQTHANYPYCFWTPSLCSYNESPPTGRYCW